MNCLILSAGKGLRMGVIGETLPKPLWPIFEKEMLFLQIARAKEIGCKKIFINIYHLSSIVKQAINENSPDVEVIEEPELLGVGGAIHNLKDQIGLSGKLLIINSDIFYFFSHDSFYKTFDGPPHCFLL